MFSASDFAYRTTVASGLFAGDWLQSSHRLWFKEHLECPRFEFSGCGFPESLSEPWGEGWWLGDRPWHSYKLTNYRSARF
jgi:hypothetical protein